MPILLAIHACVLGSVAGVALGLGLRPLSAAVMLITGVLPLAIGIRGLFSGSRYTRQWLAIVLVFYFGIGLAETTASLGHSFAAITLVFSAALELLLLLRSLRAPQPAARESGES